MPTRIQPFITDEIYHVFNKSSDHREIFKYSADNRELENILNYYRHVYTPIRYSRYKASSQQRKNEINIQFQIDTECLSDILAYCIMPTHYHLLLKQKTNSGISKYIGITQNAYTRYFNTKYHRKGHIFIHEFHAVLIKTEEQLKHVMRYIHLNPYSSRLLKNKEEVLTYPWSSIGSYIKNVKSANVQIETNLLMSCFQHNKERLKLFLMDHADYQQRLEYCKHAYVWENK